jgi:hypothetical protein
MLRGQRNACCHGASYADMARQQTTGTDLGGLSRDLPEMFALIERPRLANPSRARQLCQNGGKPVRDLGDVGRLARNAQLRRKFGRAVCRRDGFACLSEDLKDGLALVHATDYSVGLWR